jgi:hypothetical protein
MKLLTMILICISVNFAQGAVVSPISFQAEVSGFDKKWVSVTANKKKFLVSKKVWESANGPVKSGPIKASLPPAQFAEMLVGYSNAIMATR